MIQVPGQTLFPSEEAYLSYCKSKGYNGTDTRYFETNLSDKPYMMIITIRGTIRKEIVKPMMEALRHTLIGEKEVEVADKCHEILLANGDILFPGWRDHCCLTGLLHAYELLHGHSWSGGSLLKLWDLSLDVALTCRAGIYIKYLGDLATKMGISFLCYTKENDSIEVVGNGTWVDDFLLYHTGDHVVPISTVTSDINAYILTAPNGLVVRIDEIWFDRIYKAKVDEFYNHGRKLFALVNEFGLGSEVSRLIVSTIYSR